MSFEQLLENTTVDSIVPNQNLIVIGSQDSLPKAFHILISNNIYSAPVYDSSKGTYSGFLDLLDIVTFIVHIFDSQEPKRSSADLYHLLEQVEMFDREHATRVVGLSSQHPMNSISSGDSVSKAIEMFGRTGVHRIPIMEGGKIKNVLTQSLLINWLQQNKSQIPENMRKQRVSDLSVGFKPVVSIQAEAKAIDAFRLMAKYKIHGVAVLDENGCILSNLSAKDIKVLDEDALFTKLYKSTIDLVKQIRAKRINISAPSFCVTPKGTMEEVISKLSLLRVHRLYIEDEQRKPVGVLSLGDVLKVIAPAETAK